MNKWLFLIFGVGLPVLGSAQAPTKGSANYVSTFNFTIGSYLTVTPVSGTVNFTTVTGSDTNQAAGSLTFTVGSNSPNGYSGVTTAASTLTVTPSPSNPSPAPTVTATKQITTGTGTGITNSDIVKIAFTESTTWTVPATTQAGVAGNPYTFTVTLTLTNNT